MRDSIGPPAPDHGRCRQRLASVAPQVGPQGGPQGGPGAAATSRTWLARLGERWAAGHLAEHHALEILACNYRVAVEDLRGELDVIALDRRSRLLVVCEVKTRSTRTRGGALVALGMRQQIRIRRMTAVLLANGALRASRVRFDLVAIDLDPAGLGAELVHVVDAW